jgi:hypothetical protein
MSQINIFSTRSQSIEYRTPAQHRLYKKDDHFDFLFNAFLKCEKYLKNIIYKIFCDHHEELVDSLVNEYIQSNSSITSSSNPLLSSSSNINDMNTIPISFINTGLSGLDREYLINNIVTNMENKFLNEKYIQVSITDSPCNMNIKSAHDFLIEICEHYYNKLKLKAIDKDKRLRKSDYLFKNNHFLSKISDMPMQCIKTLYETTMNSFKYDSNDNNSNSENNSNSDNSLIIILRHSERLYPELFKDLIEKFHESRTIMRVHFIVFNSSSCPLPLRISKTVQSLISVSIFNTQTPFYLYDDFMGRCLSDDQIPFSFPKAILDWINESFWRSNSCIHSTLNKLLLCLHYHFSFRCSLLCMFQETKWLNALKIIRKILKNDEENYNKSIKEILLHLDANDLKNTGILVAINDKNINSNMNEEVRCVHSSLNQCLIRSMLDQALFKILKVSYKY